MKYCPECGSKRKNDVCICGFNFKDYEEKEEKNEQLLFSEPGMREMNEPYKKVDYNEIHDDFEKAKMSMYESAKKMGLDNNVSSDEFELLMKDKHFTA